MTRTLIHYHKKRTPKTIAQRKGKAHLHFCVERDCRLIYEDACEDVASNGRCHTHRGARRPIWMSARDPQECCIGNCEMVADPDELHRYRLAGPGPWYQCKTCARTHGWPCA